ncbi:MAG: zinc ribbon domain-containing protein [Acidobacteriia bacterium]|nr:zinc ribbon domain-containing protein [Terriglobia bacterium]
MPLYEYKCESCGETFEVIQKFSDEPLKVHEKCGGGPVERLISPSALKFKGSGWYVNDYGGSKNGKGTEAKAAKDSKKESTGSSTDSSTKSESKSSSSTPASTSDKKG